MIAAPHDPDADVCIAGAGPVGSFLACLLGAAGVRTRVAERRTAPPARSMAIGIMPPTLRRFAALGLASPLVAAGCGVERAVVHDGRRALGDLGFASLPPPYPFVLALPQGELVRTLWARMDAVATFAPGTAVEGFAADADGVEVRLRSAREPAGRALRCRFLVLCDGVHGRLSAELGLDTPPRPYRPTFVMGDAKDGTGWGAEAHLFFTPEGSIESFPLPDGLRRWVALTRSGDPADTAEALCARVSRLAGVPLRTEDLVDASRFTPAYRLARSFAAGRVALCGDAAHTMSPIGGQGMNTGLMDAWHLAGTLVRLVRTGDDPAGPLRRYGQVRRRAFRRAARRAAIGMWVGTRTGTAVSAVRARVVRGLLQRRAMQPRLARFFSMTSIPAGRDAALDEMARLNPTRSAAP